MQDNLIRAYTGNYNNSIYRKIKFIYNLFLKSVRLEG